MGEGVLFSFAGKVLWELSFEASKHLGMLIGLKDDLKKLRSNVSAIQALLTDAEERPTKSRSLKDWLQKLGEALYDADDVLDEMSSEVLGRQAMTRGKIAKEVWIFFSKSNQLAFNYRMSRRIKKIWKRLAEICEEKISLGLVEKSEARNIQYDGLSQPMETHSALNVDEVIGRDNDKMRIKSLLLDVDDVKDHNVSFIAIAGMGGIGKTTLAKLLFNDTQVSEHFEPKMWVWVSEEFDVKRVVEKMINSASGSNPNVQELGPLGCKFQELIKGKKYLLVMDDMWNESEEKWEQLKPLLMGGARGSKILITKRNSNVPAEVERMTELINLKGLSDGSSWSLFQKVAFKEDVKLANPNMIRLGKQILEKCGGVPLVIRHVGRLLYLKFSEQDWISFLNDELLRITQENNNMTSIFKFSYQHLPPHLKLCFAYSSLYTKNEYIDKDQLLKQWVAHGFVQSPSGSKSMEDIAKDYFTELSWRFFYEHDHYGNGVRMHDMMRDLARMVAGTGYARGNLSNEDVGERIHHFSIGHDIKSLNDLPPQLLKAKGLRTLRMSGFESINETDLDKLISNFPRLRVLDLSGGNIKLMPNCLKKLKHLRYLDLSGNNFIQSLPNCIGELVNLQTLNLNGCKALTELPRHIDKLVNLRHLELDCRSKLTHMPKGIGKLTCLQTLNLFVLDENKQGSKISELNELRDLRGGLYIKGLEQLRGNPSEAKLGNLKDNKGLRDLVLQWKPRSNEEETKDVLNDATVLEGLELHPNVESICIWRYKGEGLPNWMTNPVSKLTHISIAKCNRLRCLPELHQLPTLKKLQLQELTSLQFIDKNNPGSSTSVFFPCLDVLILKDMPNLEGWWELGSEKRKESLPNFGRLTELCIYDCPKLHWVPRQPCLKKVESDNVGVGMVTSIGPSFHLWYVTLKNIKDLEYLPRELCSSSVVKLNISNCPSLQQWAIPPFVNLNSDYYWNFGKDQPLMPSPDVIEGWMRKASRPPVEDLGDHFCWYQNSEP